MPDPLTLVPPWESMHPLIVHFPIALLLTAPALLVAGLFASGAPRRTWMHAALLLMVLGTAGAWVAVASGEAGEGAADRVPGTSDLLHEHEELAEAARNAFTVLTLVFAAILLAPRLLHRPLEGTAATIVLLVFLAAWAAGSLVLANAAHHGGRLVHERGVRAFAGAESAGVGGETADRAEEETERRGRGRGGR